MTHDTIPKELQHLPIWLVWKREPGKDGKPTKVPYRADGIGKASSTDPSTWAYLPLAQGALDRGGYDGLGIGISGDIAAIDIDHCFDPINGPSPMAKIIVEAMDTYTEISPSGTGLRLLFKAPGFKYNKARYYIKNPTNGLEIYIAGCTSRYVTITGNVLEHKPIGERSRQIAAVLETYMMRPQIHTVNSEVPSLSAIPDLIEKIRASEQGELFHRLFDQGDTSAHNGDDSAADLALCNLLAFWTKKGAGQMDKLFRQSKLYRPKWDEKRGALTYGEITIIKTISGCTTVYTGEPPKSTAAQDFGKKGPPPTASAVQTSVPKLEIISARDLQSKELPPPLCIVSDLLTQGLALLCAPPKYGKSWMVLDLCLSVAAGEPFLGYTTTAAGSLYMALEDGLRRLQERMGKVLQGKPAPEHFHFTTQALPVDAGLAEQVAEHLRQYPNTKLVVVDVLARVRSASMPKGMGAFAQDYQDTAALKSIADKHGICVLVVHHTRKMRDDSDVFNTISGTNGIMGAADTIIVLERDKRTDGNSRFFLTGRDVEAKELVITMDKGAYRWRRIGTVQEQEAERERMDYESDPVVKTIKLLLEAQPVGVELSASEFFTEMGCRVGDYGGHTPESLGKYFSKLAPKLMQYDRLIYTKPRTTRAKKHGFRTFSPTSDTTDTLGTKGGMSL